MAALLVYEEGIRTVFGDGDGILKTMGSMF
jgi:hypothetical protein